MMIGFDLPSDPLPEATGGVWWKRFVATVREGWIGGQRLGDPMCADCEDDFSRCRCGVNYCAIDAARTEEASR